MSEHEPKSISSRLSKKLFQWIACTTVASMTALTAGWWLFGRSLITKMYEGRFQSFFVVPLQIRGVHSEEELFHWMTKVLIHSTGLALILSLNLVLNRDWLHPSETNHRYREWFWIAVGSATCALVLWLQGYNSQWYPIGKAMTFQADPPYLHRVLFVLLAKSIQWFSGLSDYRSFFLSQCVAIILAMFAIQKLAELFVERSYTFMAPVLLTVILAPTFSYFTFYDIGVVFFYSAGLALLFQRKRGPFLFIIAMATLNHENILLLIVVSALVCFGERKWLVFVAVQFAVYAAIRATLFSLMPVSRVWAEGNVWINVEYILFKRSDLAGTLVLFVWFAAALYIARISATAELKRCTILFPLLFGTTILVGQLNEARQFDAFIPVAVVLILGALSPTRIPIPVAQVCNISGGLY